MESIKKLQDAAKECLSDLRSIDSRVSIAEGTLLSLENQKKTLNAEIKDLEQKKAVILEFIGRAEIESKRQQEDKLQELKQKASSLDLERAKCRTLEIQLEESRKSAETAKSSYDRLYSEYSDKLSELNQKREALNAVLK